MRGEANIWEKLTRRFKTVTVRQELNVRLVLRLQHLSYILMLEVENAAASACTAGFEELMRPDAQLRFSAEDGRAVQTCSRAAIHEA